MPRPRRNFLSWPADIPRNQRVALTAGHRSFCRHRRCVVEEGYDRQEIVLKNHLLLLVHRGTVILERDGREWPVYEGDGCIVAEGRFYVTEASTPPISYFENRAFFFNDGILDQIVGKSKMIRGLAMVNSMPDSGLFPLRGKVKDIRKWLERKELTYETGFLEILKCLLNLVSASIFGFLKHRYFIPRGAKPMTLEELYAEFDKKKGVSD